LTPLTETTTHVDAPRAVMWTVSQVADRDAVSKQAVSKRVRDLADKHGLAVERDPRGHIIRLNVAEYDHLRGRYSDPSKAQAPRREMDAAPRGESYDEALRQKTWHDAERARLNLEELKGELIRVSAIVDAVGHCGVAISRAVDRLVNDADDITAMIARDGVHGCRVILKSIAARLRNDIADALADLARSTPPQMQIDSPMTAPIADEVPAS
jgi:hypothetical protein